MGRFRFRDRDWVKSIFWTVMLIQDHVLIGKITVKITVANMHETDSICQSSVTARAALVFLCHGELYRHWKTDWQSCNQGYNSATTGVKSTRYSETTQ